MYYCVFISPSSKYEAYVLIAFFYLKTVHYHTTDYDYDFLLRFQTSWTSFTLLRFRIIVCETKHD